MDHRCLQIQLFSIFGTFRVNIDYPPKPGKVYISFLLVLLS